MSLPYPEAGIRLIRPDRLDEVNRQMEAFRSDLGELYAYWTTHREVTTEVVDARKVRFEHKDLAVIVQSHMAARVLDTYAIEQGHAGVLFEDGRYTETLPPGRYAFWKGQAKVTVVPMDLREVMLDIGGQEIMTEGGPLKLETIVDGKVKKTDNIRSAYEGLLRKLKIKGKDRKPLKLIRETSSNKLAEHRDYARFAQYFLGQAPATVADKHYVQPSQW
ncbi:MAG: hypothetical protein RBS80_31035 [Thermoguttaceae bacterium]|nr:hypothetical protein [Thermoguttaceae bacterium]